MFIINCSYIAFLGPKVTFYEIEDGDISSFFPNNLQYKNEKISQISVYKNIQTLKFDTTKGIVTMKFYDPKFKDLKILYDNKYNIVTHITILNRLEMINYSKSTSVNVIHKFNLFKDVISIDNEIEVAKKMYKTLRRITLYLYKEKCNFDIKTDKIKLILYNSGDNFIDSKKILNMFLNNEVIVNILLLNYNEQYFIQFGDKITNNFHILIKNDICIDISKNNLFVDYIYVNFVNVRVEELNDQGNLDLVTDKIHDNPPEYNNLLKIN